MKKVQILEMLVTKQQRITVLFFTCKNKRTKKEYVFKSINTYSFIYLTDIYGLLKALNI